MGVLLDTYFQSHSQINFDLLVNSLILHYKISPEIEDVVALALKDLFNISEEEKFV
jgi:hypothetical protein